MNRLVLALVAAVMLVSCGRGGPELAEVTGRVTLDGKPVPNATLIFVPRIPGGSTSYGQTDEEGRYTLMFTFKSEGAMIGTHDVKIETEVPTAAEVEELRAAGQKVPEAVKLPGKYGKKGELTAVVEPGDNEVNFELSAR